VDAPLLNLLVALGIGLLVGVERERTNLAIGAPAAAGLRTFSIAALIGAVAEAAGGPILLAVFGAAVAGFMALSYWRTANAEGPGLTTEFALLLTVLAGGLAMRSPGAGGAVGVVTAVLLAARERLHHFAGSVLTEDELRSALILTAAVVVIMPLLPDAQMGPFGALNPRSVWRLVVLVLLIGAAGYLATRILGPRYGLPISGLASGFVSSSATIGAMGSRAKTSPAVITAAAAGAVLSTVATVAQMAAVVGATSAPALEAMTPPLIGAGVAAAAYGAVFTLAVLRQPPAEVEQEAGDPFSLAAALMFAVTLSAVLVGAAALRQWFGEAGALVAAGLAGFVDTHASAISIASLVATGRMAPQDCVLPILVGFSTNTVTKVILASTSGGRGFALRVVPGVVLVALAAWAGALAAAVAR
jgi:uncharacterized membrane protein (DUF4010 family)